MVKWSILIPTVVNRPEEFQRLADVLAPQAAKYKGDIEVVVYWNNYEQQIGPLRQQMLEDARGEYVSFIDDDDLVPDYYCDEIYPLLDGVDYIGFRMDFYSNGVLQKPVNHSLKNEKWDDEASEYLRRGTHLNPVRRELALLGGYDKSDYKKGRSEDATYASDVDQHLKTEHFIDKIMYYYYQTDSHAWGVFEPMLGVHARPKLRPYFRFHPRSTK